LRVEDEVNAGIAVVAVSRPDLHLLELFALYGCILLKAVTHDAQAM